MIQPFRALTLKSSAGVLRVIRTPCQACSAFDPKSPPDPVPTLAAFHAIWDTGATHSAIGQNVVDGCGLKPTGMKEVHGVHGTALVETFLVNIMLPNGVGFPNVEVTLGKLSGADILVGMDIITRGDLSITNVGGRTVFTFRNPSCESIDYVEQARVLTEVGGPGSGPHFTHGIRHKKKKRPPKQFGKNKRRR